MAAATGRNPNARARPASAQRSEKLSKERDEATIPESLPSLPHLLPSWLVCPRVCDQTDHARAGLRLYPGVNSYPPAIHETVERVTTEPEALNPAYLRAAPRNSLHARDRRRVNDRQAALDSSPGGAIRRGPNMLPRRANHWARDSEYGPPSSTHPQHYDASVPRAAPVTSHQSLNDRVVSNVDLWKQV